MSRGIVVALMLSILVAGAASAQGVAPLRLGSPVPARARADSTAQRLTRLDGWRVRRATRPLPECRMPVARTDVTTGPERMPGSFEPAAGGNSTEAYGCTNPLAAPAAPRTPDRRVP